MLSSPSIVRLLGLLLVFCFSGASLAFGDPSSGFNIATYNINYGNPDLARVVASIEQSDADIVYLQEVNKESAKHLKEHLTDDYPYMAFYPGKWATGFAFLSKAPLEGVRYLPPRHGPFGAYVATVTIKNMTLRLLNVHLTPNLPKRGEGLFAFMQRALIQEGNRIAELEAWLAEEPATDEVVRVVAGDFNSMRGLGLLSHIEKGGFEDTFSRVTPDPEDHPSWHWRYGGHALRLRIDHILVEANELLPTNARVLVDEHASDHFLVVVSFDEQTQAR